MRNTRNKRGSMTIGHSKQLEGGLLPEAIHGNNSNLQIFQQKSSVLQTNNFLNIDEGKTNGSKNMLAKGQSNSKSGFAVDTAVESPIVDGGISKFEGQLLLQYRAQTHSSLRKKRASNVSQAQPSSYPRGISPIHCPKDSCKKQKQSYVGPEGLISLNEYLGIDRRGSSAFQYYRKSLAQSVLGSSGVQSPAGRRALSKQKQRVDFDYEKSSLEHNTSEVQERQVQVKKKQTPLNRPTIFTKPGDYNGSRNYSLFFRTKQQQSLNQNQDLNDTYGAQKDQNPQQILSNRSKSQKPSIIPNVNINTNRSSQMTIETQRTTESKRQMKIARVKKPIRVPKSQQNMPENVKKHSNLVAQAKEKLLKEKTIYRERKLSNLDPAFKQFESMVERIPEFYVTADTKSKFIKTKQLMMHRTVQAKVLEKTTNDWSTNNMIKMVLQEKRENKIKEIMQRKKERDLELAKAGDDPISPKAVSIDNAACEISF